MARPLGYQDYRNFVTVIEKAKEACNNSGYNDKNHFVEFTELIRTGKGARRPVEAFRLSRYACYLIIQNADPSKDLVAGRPDLLRDPDPPPGTGGPAG